MTATLSRPIVSFEPPPKRYRVGEISQHTGLSRQTLHNYTAMGLIREAGWTAGGHRLYGEEVFGRLAKVAELKQTMRMDEIARILEEGGESGGG